MADTNKPPATTTDTKTADAKKPAPTNQGYVVFVDIRFDQKPSSVKTPITAPVNLNLKDEVELLRGGYKDKDGHQLKSQATVAKPTPAKTGKVKEVSCESVDSKPVPKKKKKKEATVEIEF